MVMSLKTQICTTLFSKTQSFYEAVFGMVVLEEWDDSNGNGPNGDEPKDKGVILAFPSGKHEAFLEIYLSQTAHDYDGISLQFNVESMTDFVAGLPWGIEVEGPIIRPWGSAYLYLKDPNNIQVIAYEERN